MSALLVLENGVVHSAWQGELPKEGDVIWDEDARRLLRVTTVVHVVSVQKAPGSQQMPIAYPTSLRRIFVEDMTGETGTKELVSMLKTLRASGV